MQLLFIKQWLTTELAQALCWTLVHSLWQGLLLAIVAGGIILFTRKSGPALRYNLLAALFLMFLVAVSSTFVMELGNANKTTQSIAANALQLTDGSLTLPVTPTSREMQAAQDPSYMDSFVNYFNQHASLIVAIWFIIFSARLVKIMTGLGYIQRIRHYKTHSPAVYWTTRLQQLGKQLQLHRSIRLLESEIVKVPLVVGFLKPLVLLPFGMITHLPSDQVEAILLHELAHIKRKDYFINLLQSFGETLFFFNPAVLWLSALIREEREHCCDDIAIGITKSKTKFIDALVSFHEYNTAPTSYAMAFPGKKDHLLNRVKRIVHNNNQSLNTIEKAFLVCCLLLTFTITLVYAQSSKKEAPVQKITTSQKAPVPKTIVVSTMLRDTVPTRVYKTEGVQEGTTITYADQIDGKPCQTYLLKKEGVLYHIIKQGNEIVQFRINEQVITGKTITEHTPLINRLLEAFKQSPKTDVRPVVTPLPDTVIAPVPKVLATPNPTVAIQPGNIIITPKSTIKAENDRNAAEDHARQLEIDRSKREEDKLDLQSEIATERRQLQSRVQHLDKQLSEERKRLAELDALQTTLKIENNVSVSTNLNYTRPKLNYTPPKLNYNANYQRQLKDYQPYQPNDNSTKEVIEELIRENIIKDNTGNLSIRFTQSDLIVNGVQQSKTLHKKLKDKYLPKGEWTLTRNTTNK